MLWRVTCYCPGRGHAGAASLGLRVAGLGGWSTTLLAIINPPGSADYDRLLRATLHVPVERGRALIQVIDYVGNDRAGHTGGRRFPANAGLVAQVLQAGSGLAASREIANHEVYVRELVEKWGYTEEAARRRDMSAMVLDGRAAALAESGGR